jgi:type IX secretion system PorP/SprF family membrane protein
MKRTITIIILMLLSQAYLLYAQIPVNHSLYYENVYTINPAGIFQDDYFNASLIANRSFVGFENAPAINGVYLHGPVSNNVGLGLSVINSKMGIFDLNNFTGSYAYRLKFSEDHYLTMGLSMGLSWQKMDYTQINAISLDDPILISASYNDKKYFINELGFLYQLKRLEIGLSAPYIVQPEYQQFYGYVSYDIKPSGMKGFEITPMVFYQYLPIGTSQIDLSCKFRYKPLWTSVSYRSNKNVFLAMGASFDKFKIAYSYEINNELLSRVGQSSQELMVAYTFNFISKTKNKEIKYDLTPQNSDVNTSD